MKLQKTRWKILCAMVAALGFATLWDARDDSLLLAKAPNRSGSLRKSTEEPLKKESEKNKTPKAAPKQTPKKQNPTKQSAPAAQTNPAAQPAPDAPIGPPPKPKTQLERMSEDVQNAKNAVAQNKPLDAFKRACNALNKVKKKELDRLGDDGAGKNAEEYRQLANEALKIAEESANELDDRPADPQKTLTFFF